MKQEEKKEKVQRSRAKEMGGGEERERGWIKVGGARPSHFLRFKITTILLLLLN